MVELRNYLINKLNSLEKRYMSLVNESSEEYIDASEFALEEEDIAENMAYYLFEKYGLRYSNQKFYKIRSLCKEAVEDMYEKDNFSEHIMNYVSFFFEDVDNIRLNADYDHLIDMTYSYA